MTHIKWTSTILIELIEHIESKQQKISDLLERSQNTHTHKHTQCGYVCTYRTNNIWMRWHRSSDKFDDSLQQLTREPIKKTISTKQFPLWCKYFHISACTLTYWHINCNLVRFIWFYFCAIRCFLFGRFYFSLIYFFFLHCPPISM